MQPAPAQMPPEPREILAELAAGGSSRPRLGFPATTAGVEVRNTGVTSVGPGYLGTLRRVDPLLGQTLPERQVYDLLAGMALLRREAGTGAVTLFGQGHTAPWAIYAALLDPNVSEVILADLPESHEDPETPEFLGIALYDWLMNRELAAAGQGASVRLFPVLWLANCSRAARR